MGSQGDWGSRHIIIFIQQGKSLTGLVSYVQHYRHSTLTTTLLGSLGHWGTGALGHIILFTRQGNSLKGLVSYTQHYRH